MAHPAKVRRFALFFQIGAVVTVLGLLGCDLFSTGDEPDNKSRAGDAVANQRSSSESGTTSKSGTSAVHMGPAQVTLSGKTEPLSVVTLGKGGEKRLYARQLSVGIYEKPTTSSRKLGYMRAGASSPTKAQPAGYEGCKGGWQAVEPEGYICNGVAATFDVEDPVVQAFQAHPPDSAHTLPYRYGTVRKPGPAYGRIPTVDEVREAEPDFEKRFAEWLDAKGETGATFRQDLWDRGRDTPDPRRAFEERLNTAHDFVAHGARNFQSPLGIPRPSTAVIDQMLSRVGYAFLETFFLAGRRYGLTTQLEIVPTDRFRPILGSEFHGVEIGRDVQFPFAFVRRPDATFSDGSPAGYRSVLSLTGKRKFLNGRLSYETKDGKYISDRFASELTLAKKMPGWALKGEKWISISIAKQTLVLYEGQKPVYATLVSTGEAGLESSEETTATKRGIFRIHTKHITSTMSSDEAGEEFELRDVPYVQYFDESGFALHGAYWHDQFGTPKSHGCVNLSPEDARRIFHWTEPQVPVGWHGALLPLRGTVVFVHP